MSTAEPTEKTDLPSTSPSTHEQTSFFSLPFVSKLLWYAQWADHSQWRQFDPPHPTLKEVLRAMDYGVPAAVGHPLAVPLPHHSAGETLPSEANVFFPQRAELSTCSAAPAISSSLPAAINAPEFFAEPGWGEVAVENDVNRLLCPVLPQYANRTLEGYSSRAVGAIVRRRIEIERFYLQHYAETSEILCGASLALSDAFWADLNASKGKGGRGGSPTSKPAAVAVNTGSSFSPTSAPDVGRSVNSLNAAVTTGGAAVISALPHDFDQTTLEGQAYRLRTDPTRGPGMRPLPRDYTLLRQLRAGLARALGLTLPPHDSHEDDLCLDRERCTRLLAEQPSRWPPGGGGTEASSKSGAVDIGRVLERCRLLPPALPSKQRHGSKSGRRKLNKGSGHSGSGRGAQQSREEEAAPALSLSSSYPSACSPTSPTSTTSHMQSLSTAEEDQQDYEEWRTKIVHQLAALPAHHPLVDAVPPAVEHKTALLYSLMGDNPLNYLEDDREGCSTTLLKETILLEWFEDMLQAAYRWRFSPLQTRALLLVGRSLCEAIENLTRCDVSNEDEVENALEAHITGLLTHLLTPAACASEVRASVPPVSAAVLPTGDERAGGTPSSIMTDAGASSSAISDRRRPLKSVSKKSSPVSSPRSAILSPMRFEITVHVEPVVRTLTYPPLFRLDELGAVLDFFLTSALKHWRLFAYAFHEAPPVQTVTFALPLDSVQRAHIPPLTEFLPVDFFTMEEERFRLVEEAEKQLHTLYQECFAQSLQKLAEAELEERLQWLADREEAEIENRNMALNGADFDRISESFQLRLLEKSKKNDQVGPAAAQERFLHGMSQLAAGMLSEASNSPTRGLPAGRAAGAARARVVSPRDTTRPMSPADAVTIDQDAVFLLEEVEERVEAIENSVKEREAAGAAAATKSKSNKGGKGRRG